MPTSTTGSSNNRRTICSERFRYSSEHGFTLMELIVVMVLLSLLTAFAVPRIRTSLFTDQLKSTGRALTGLISETGQEARRSHHPWLLIYDPAHRWFVARPDTGLAPDAPAYQSIRPVTLPDSIQVRDIITARGGLRNEGELRLRFTARGYVDQTLIHLADDAGRALTLALSPFLGSIRMYDTYMDLEEERAQWQ